MGILRKFAERLELTAVSLIDLEQSSKIDSEKIWKRFRDIIDISIKICLGLKEGYPCGCPMDGPCITDSCYPGTYCVLEGPGHGTCTRSKTTVVINKWILTT